MERIFESVEKLMERVYTENMSEKEIAKYYWETRAKVFEVYDENGEVIPAEEDRKIFDGFADRVFALVSRDTIYDYDDCDYDD